MAKDLSGTNIAAQKEALHNRPVFLVTINRDHPDAAASPYYVGTATKSYALDGKAYLDLLTPDGLDDMIMAITPGGGIATVSEWGCSLVNPDENGDRLSYMLDNYYLENQDITLALVFRTGSEVAADVLTMFAGTIQDSENDTGTFRLSAKDGSEATLKTLPQDVADPVTYPRIPLDNVSRPIPWAFGNLNVEPFNTSGARAVLAPCICVDAIDQKYTPGRQCKSYGQPYVFYRTARYYGRIEDYTQDGDYFTVDSSQRYSEIRPMRPMATNDVADWRNVVDGSTATSAAIANGDALHLQMRGSPKMGTIDAISIEIVATDGYDYTIVKTGEANITNSVVGDASIDLSGWDFETNWDFEQIEVQIDGTGDAQIATVVLAITFLEHETGDQLAFPVFQAVEGFEDQATRYPDGAVIEGAGTVLRNPLSAMLAFLRQSQTGMRMPIAQIETSNLAAERAKIAAWVWDFSVQTEWGRPELSEVAEQGKIRMFRTYDGKWKLSVFDKTAAPVAMFSHDWNIAVRNSEAPADQQESSLTCSRSDLAEVYNEFVLHYGWDDALQDYTQREIASPYYTTTGTCTLDAGTDTLHDDAGQFVTLGIQPGYRVFVVREQAYTVVSVTGETDMVLDPVAAGGLMADGFSDEYYVGPNFDWQCFRSVLKYRTTQRRTLYSKMLQDEDTAIATIAHYVDYWTERRTVARLRTGLNAVDLELTDFAILDHPDLPQSKCPQELATLNGDVSAATDTLTLAGSGAYLVRDDDVLVLRAAGSDRLYHEIVIVTATDGVAGTVTVDRAQAGTQARAWLSGDKVQRAVTKFELVELKPLPNDGMMDLAFRETPRDYVAIMRYAAEDTSAWIDASAEDRAIYGFYTHPNGEASWLDEESVYGYAPE